MNYEAFFKNTDREWSNCSTTNGKEFRSLDGYTLALEYDVKYASYVWNLYKFDREAPDGYTLKAHNVPDNVIPHYLR